MSAVSAVATMAVVREAAVMVEAEMAERVVVKVATVARLAERVVILLLLLPLRPPPLPRTLRNRGC